MTESNRRNAEKIEGRKYKVISEDNWAELEIGTVVTLRSDDGTEFPWFTDNTGEGFWMPVSSLEILPEEPQHITEEEFSQLKAGDKFTIIDPLKAGYSYKDFSMAEWRSTLEIKDYRKVLPHEVAKLEAAEKEHGCVYQKPLINEVGTVIEVGQYYKSIGLGGVVIYCVTNVTSSSFCRGDKELNIQTGEMEFTVANAEIGSFYGKSAVPATPEEIALFEQAKTANSIKIGNSYTVDFDIEHAIALTVTAKVGNNFQVKYKGLSGKSVGDSIPVTDKMWLSAKEITSGD